MARDMGPVFVGTSDGHKAIADFNFDAWGYARYTRSGHKTEELYDVRVAELMQLPVVSSSMISEGGNREVNGKGTLIVTASVGGRTQSPYDPALIWSRNTGDCSSRKSHMAESGTP